MFSRAGGKEPSKKKSDVAEALGEVAKHVSAAFSGAMPSTRSSSGNTASPAKSIIVQNVINSSVSSMI